MIKSFLRKHGLFFLITFLSLVLLYYPQLNGDFIGDDIGRIKDLPENHFFTILYKFLGDRPLLVTAMWLDRAIFGFDVFGMKLENLFIVSCLFIMARILIDEVATYFSLTINPWFRDLVLFFFAIHPLNTQAFGHVIQRGALLATLFGMLATYLILKSKGSPKKLSWKIGLLFWCLALMAKPNIAFLPIWWGIILWMGGDKKNILYLAIYLLMLFIPYAGYEWGGFNPQSGADAISHWQYFLTQARVLLVYFKLLIWPSPLYFIYNFKSSMPDEIFPGVLLWLGYISLIGVLLYKIQNKGIKVFLLGGFLAFIPESSFFRIIHVIFEHRTFTPFLFFLSGLTFINIKLNKKVVTSVFLILFTVYGIVTYNRSLVAQKYESWALHDFEQGGCEVPYNVFYVAHQFLRRGKIEVARKVLELNESCKASYFVDPLITAEIDLVSSKEFSQDIFDRYKRILHSDISVSCIVRNQSNLFFIENTIKIYGNESSCYSEELISHQLKYIIKHPIDCYASLEYYVMSSNACLIDLRKSPEKNVQKLLKIRTIRFVYFQRSDATLRDDLVKNNKDNQNKYLLELYDRSLENRKRLAEELKKIRGNESF